jgi:hypothetical protein
MSLLLSSVRGLESSLRCLRLRQVEELYSLQPARSEKPPTRASRTAKKKMEKKAAKHVKTARCVEMEHDKVDGILERACASLRLWRKKMEA